ncbi:MAG: hypothetical protein C0404_05415 [Verrucomicrobia bacterium]|nr:hypothetical protein [Verrucomicrobiota bacterium]
MHGSRIGGRMTTPSRDALADLMSRHVDGLLSDDETLTLRRLAETDPAVARDLALALCVHAALVKKFDPDAKPGDRTDAIMHRIRDEQRGQDIVEPGVTRAIRRQWAIPLAIAASLLVAVGVWRFATTGAKPAGTDVVTGRGQTIALRFDGEDTSVDVAENTKLRVVGGTVIAGAATDSLLVKSGPGKLIQLESGSIKVSAAKQTEGRSFVVTTPQADMKVVGTEFDLLVDEKVTCLDVDQGLVKFTRLADGKAIDVAAGQFAVAIASSAGTAFSAVDGHAADSVSSLTAGKPASGRPPPGSKFDTPAWNPDARWERDPKPFTGSFNGELAGPRQEIMIRHAWGSAPIQFPGMTQGGRYICFTYDSRTERYFPMAGSTQGYLDGPFSRARFGGADYTARPRAVLSPDGRYGYMNDVRNGGKLRFLDFEKQEVKTFLPERRFNGSMVVNSRGELLSLGNDGTLLFIGPDGRIVKQGLQLEHGKGVNSMGDFGATLALDEKKNRLYAGAMSKEWYYWYWDLADGSFHGLIPVPNPGDVTRERPGIGACLPGPFKGTALYGEGSALLFGPDDPGNRFLYSTRVDTHILFRLDIEKEYFSSFSGKEGRFLDSGRPVGNSCAGTSSPVWLADGSFVGESNYRWSLFKRVK